MIRFNKKEMDKKYKYWMEFIKSVEEESGRVKYETTEKPEKSS